MKRIFALTVCLCLLLSCGCGKKNKEPAPVETTAQTTLAPTQTSTPETEPTVPVTEPSVPATEPTQPPTEPTEPPVVYYNPYNGRVLEAPYSGHAVAVVINNLKDALPHYGVSGADIFYEAETEGGITRCLAVFSQPEYAGTIGPVRSVRTFFNSLALSYNVPIVHCGGSVRGRNGYSDRDGGKISGWQHLDQIYNGSYFFRDQQRYSSGYNWEHTLFTTGPELIRGLTARGYEIQSDPNTGLSFDDNVTLGGTAHSKLVVHFRDHKTTTFTYNPDDRLYYTEQYGSPYIDAATGEQMMFRNVMVLYTPQTYVHDGEYSRSYYELIGEGTGFLAINGENVTIRWAREDLRSPFVYTLEDGTPISFGVGSTYIAIASTKAQPVEIS